MMPSMTRGVASTRRTFRALSSRNYRLFWSGQVVSLTGTWMQRLAQSWLASGAYRAVSLRRFGEPRWTSFVVGTDHDEPVMVRLPVDP